MKYWLKQNAEKPLYTELGWDKPERKDQAGKLLIIGGNVHGFSDPARACEYVNLAGIGSARICLPDSLKRTLHSFWVDAIFCPSTPSGSFAQDGKEVILNNALWADGIFLAGDFGRNSETAILLDDLMSSMSSTIVVTKDALDYFLTRPRLILDRKDTLVVASFAQLQKLFSSYGSSGALTYTMPLANLVRLLHEFTLKSPAYIITKFSDKYVVAVNGQVSTTDCPAEGEVWRLETASRAVVSLLHHPGKMFEALTHSVL